MTTADRAETQNLIEEKFGDADPVSVRYVGEIERLVNIMTPNDLQEYVDLSDVKYNSDNQFLGNWRVSVIDTILEAAESGESWALDMAVNS